LYSQKPKLMPTESKIFIKGMVCQRCILVVKTRLQQLGMEPLKVSLGEVTVITASPLPDHELIEQSLKPLGFQLIEDKKVKAVNAIRRLVAEVYSGSYDFPAGFRFSELLKERLHRDYDSLSTLFSFMEHKTLEQHIIEYRIEKIKELLVYTDQPLSDMAFSLNFSSMAHLSRQFKQYTGLTPSHFREIRKARGQMDTPSPN
jgi:AraC family transcriptional regulator